MAKLAKVFIIILNWNRKDDVTQALKSIEGLKVEGFELNTLVIDSGSTDGSKEVLKDFKIAKGKFKFLSLPTNPGFTEGNNIGMRYALKKGADYIMLLNDDTLVDNNLVVNLLAVFKKYPDAGIVSPKIYFAKGYEFKKKYQKEDLGKVIWYAGGDIDWKNVYGTNHGVDEVDKGQFNKTKDTDFATGCCFLVKREVLKKVGLFDSRYFAYLEDADLDQRVKKAGYRVLFTPQAVLWHKVSQSSGIGSDLNDYFITRNRMLFGLTYAPLRAKIALVRESLRLLFKGRKWQKRGILDYYLGRFGKGSWK
jgi:GT2 family glycosyltransferase